MQEIRTVSESKAWLAGFYAVRVENLDTSKNAGFEQWDGRARLPDTLLKYVPPKPPEPDLTGKEVQTPEQLVAERQAAAPAKHPYRRVSDLPKRIHRAAKKKAAKPAARRGRR